MNTARTHLIAMSLSNSKQFILDKTKFGWEGQIKNLEIPSSDVYEICFDGRYDLHIIYLLMLNFNITLPVTLSIDEV